MRARSLTALLTPAVLLLGLSWLASPAFAGTQKTTLCHVPPGNPENAHEIVVSENAISAHLQNHPGDQVGTCEQGCAIEADCSDGNFCTQDVCNPDGSCDNSERRASMSGCSQTFQSSPSLLLTCSREKFFQIISRVSP